MPTKTTIIALLAGLATALPTGTNGVTPIEDVQTVSDFGDTYKYYTGNGSPSAGWPALSQWGTFAQLWAANAAIMPNTCGWNSWGAADTANEIANIKAAIMAEAKATGVDERFILAIVMQESEGCVRVPTTNNGVRNPGLMQSHNGSGTCAGVDPCPASEITQMIKDGTAGTSSGDGLKQTLSETAPTTGTGTVRNYYAAARKYNSGSVDYTNLDDGLGSTACYASDVANRLTGWVLAASSCTA